MWTLDDVDETCHGGLAEKEPAFYWIVDAAQYSHGMGMKSYLIYMTVRLLEMRRLLKPIASIYLHCDSTTSHYLKMEMDCVFWKNNFKMKLCGNRHMRMDERKNGVQFTIHYFITVRVRSMCGIKC